MKEGGERMENEKILGHEATPVLVFKLRLLHSKY